MNDNKRTSRLSAALVLGLVLALLAVGVALAAGNISATDKWAWSTDAGWVNFAPVPVSGMFTDGAAVYPDHLYDDADVAAGQTYWYWLEDIDLSGATTLHGSVSVAVQTPTAVRLGGMDATSEPLAAIPVWWIVAVVLAAAAAAGRRRMQRRES